EEYIRGTIAKEIIRGGSFPIFAYRADDYAGGSLILGYLASLYFRLLGPTAFALKLAPLTMFYGALAAWFAMLWRHASHRAAVLFALLFIFGPPALLRYSVTAMGFHS